MKMKDDLIWKILEMDKCFISVFLNEFTDFKWKIVLILSPISIIISVGVDYDFPSYPPTIRSNIVIRKVTPQVQSTKAYALFSLFHLLGMYNEIVAITACR